MSDPLGWQDRPYYREGRSGESNPILRALMWMWTGSVYLFTAFGIAVRMHAAMLVYIGLVLLLDRRPGYEWSDALTSMAFLFGVVLLHEFGHCFAARWMGGEADEILMWPLGGLAFTNPPRRPWPVFVTVAGGPMVNVVICIVCGIALYFLTNGMVPLNPFRPAPPVEFYLDDIAFYLWWLFSISYILLLFNLLPIYPMDGGRLLQSILWPRFGYYRSMVFSTTTGMIGAVVLGAYGLAVWQIMLVMLAIIGFMYCRRQLQMLRAEGPWAFSDADDAVDYSASFRTGGSSSRRSARAAKRREKLEYEARSEQERIDQILAKVSASGMQSLSWLEKRALKKATQRQRQRDAELSRLRRGA